MDRKIKRKIIEIDEEKCNGCGLCITACPEGALRIIDGKARLVKEIFCDGLGACLGDCPEGALTVTERETEEYDEEGVIAHIKENSPELLEKHLKHLKEHEHELSGMKAHMSRLCQWPIQLHLVSPSAPYFKNADLILTADCVPYAYPDFHTEFLEGRSVVIGCPKLDDIEAYETKLTLIVETGDIKSLTVVYMEVPCCYGLVHVAEEVLKKTGKDIPFKTVVVGIRGDIKL